APLDDPDHAKNAVAAAQEMRRKLIELNRAWAAEGRRTIQVGIGINTGECSVGNFGSNQKFNYSLLGDPVNLSSRLEGLTKVYGLFRERIAQLQVEAPPSDWDGVFVAQEK